MNASEKEKDGEQEKRSIVIFFWLWWHCVYECVSVRCKFFIIWYYEIDVVTVLWQMCMCVRAVANDIFAILRYFLLFCCRYLMLVTSRCHNPCQLSATYKDPRQNNNNNNDDDKKRRNIFKNPNEISENWLKLLLLRWNGLSSVRFGSTRKSYQAVWAKVIKV